MMNDILRDPRNPAINDLMDRLEIIRNINEKQGRLTIHHQQSVLASKDAQNSP